MGSSQKSSQWRSVFDGVKLKTIPSMPEALMAEINTAISSLEYAGATVLLESTSLSPSSSISNTDSSSSQSQFDARKADQACKAGCAALAAGKLDEALLSLNVSLSKCPPDQTSAVAKLQSLISLTSQQLAIISEVCFEHMFHICRICCVNSTFEQVQQPIVNHLFKTN